VKRLAAAIRMDRPFGPWEAALAFAGLVAVAALALGPHIRHGGFYLDDWANAAGSLQPPGSPDFGDAVSYFAKLTIYRPVLVIYVPLTYFVFGTHVDLHLAWAALLAVLAATAFYGVLRVLGVPWIHAWLIAALTVVFPWSDSTRLWATADQITLSLVFAGAGLLVALLGLKRADWRWHAGALALYLLSILTYEVTLPLIACVGVLYCFRVGWHKARLCWLADLTVVVGAGIWDVAHTSRTASGLTGDFGHLKQIVVWGGTLMGRAGQPLGASQTTLVLCALAGVLLSGMAAYLLLPERFAGGRGWGMRGWLLLALGGLCVAALGWVMFIPADPYYTPSVYGMTNRVNGLASFGLILVVYAAFGIIGALVGQVRAEVRPIAAAVTVLLALVLMASYAHVLRRHITIWDTAFAAETKALQKMKARIPRLPPGTTLFTSSYPVNQTLGVPIFSTTWDLDGMVKTEYEDDSLSAFPLLPEQHLVCRATGVAVEGMEAPEVTALYGSVRLLDLRTGRQAAPHGRSECRREAGRYLPGPLYLSVTY
jgi:hypothetical protein